MSEFKSKTISFAMQKLCRELGNDYEITLNSALNDLFICKNVGRNYRVLIGHLEPRYKGGSASIFLVRDPDESRPCGLSIESIESDVKFCDIVKQVDKITRKFVPELL